MILRSDLRVKRELEKFMNRFFISREKTPENLAQVYCLIDDLQSYLEDKLVEVGNDLLADPKFEKVCLVDEGLKVYVDKELQTILVDKMSKKDYDNTRVEASQEYVKTKKLETASK